jgi:IS5 family transposase
MEAVMPWQALIALIEPHDPKAIKNGSRPPYPLATMIRIHLLQQWYSLSNPAMEEAPIEVPTMRRFAGIELISDRIPDEVTILTFRLLLEKHRLGEQIFDPVKPHNSGTSRAAWDSFSAFQIRQRTSNGAGASTRIGKLAL